MAQQQGWNQQTPAVQSMLSGALRATNSAKTQGFGKKPAKRKRRARAAGAKRSASTKSSPRKSKGKRKGKFVKGSAAAKAYMASIRPK